VPQDVSGAKEALTATDVTRIGIGLPIPRSHSDAHVLVTRTVVRIRVQRVAFGRDLKLVLHRVPERLAGITIDHDIATVGGPHLHRRQPMATAGLRGMRHRRVGLTW
jgi:hypothetical protein